VGVGRLNLEAVLVRVREPADPKGPRADERQAEELRVALDRRAEILNEDPEVVKGRVRHVPPSVDVNDHDPMRAASAQS
jgi:hypothetical protein